jgi:hypothetical protein
MLHQESIETKLRTSSKLQFVRILLQLLCTMKGRQTLIFSPYVQDIQSLQELCNTLNIVHGVITGKTPENERLTVVQNFSRGQTSVLLLSTKAAYCGLNLQMADTVIIFELSENVQMDEQAISRAHRVGQTKAVNIFRLFTPEDRKDLLTKYLRKRRMANLLSMVAKVDLLPSYKPAHLSEYTIPPSLPTDSIGLHVGTTAQSTALLQSLLTEPHLFRKSAVGARVRVLWTKEMQYFQGNSVAIFSSEKCNRLDNRLRH